jgi:hypothetical protein
MHAKSKAIQTASPFRYKVFGAIGAAIALALLWVVFHLHAKNAERSSQIRKIEAVVKKGMTADQVEKIVGPPEFVKGFKFLPDGVEDPAYNLYHQRWVYGGAVIEMTREDLVSPFRVEGHLVWGGNRPGVYEWRTETERDLEDLAQRWVWLFLWLDMGALCGGHFALQQGWKPIRGILLGMVVGPLIYFLPVVKKVSKSQGESAVEMRSNPAEPGAAADGGRDAGL